MPASRFGFALTLLFACTTIACGGASGGDSGPTPPTGGDPTTPGPVSTPTSVSINQSNLIFTSLRATRTVSAEVRDQKGSVMSGATVTWASSNGAVATVSNAGVITSTGAGNANISATLGAATTSISVVVSQTVASLTVDPQNLTLTGAGSTHQLTAVARDSSGAPVVNAPVSWVSATPSVATVSPSGLVTAVGVGNAKISAMSTIRVATVNVDVQSSTGNPAGCSTRPVFGEYLIDPALLKVVTPIGIIGGGNTEIVGRSYAMPIDGMDGIPMALKAPSDLRVIAAKHYLPPGAPTTGYVPDWSILLDVGCGVTIELFHVKDLAPSIKAVVDTTIYPSSAWEPIRTPVSFRAGETFGWYQRGLNSVAFDVIAHDSNTRNRFTNQARYEQGGSNLLDIVCPWDLFTPAKRDAYLNTIGAQTGFRVAGAGCGSVNRDVDATPAGQWFRSQTIAGSFQLQKDGFYGNPMQIVLGIDSTVYVGHTGPSNDIRIDRQNSSWKNPASITTSHCYQRLNGSAPNGWLYLRMNSAIQMDVSYGDTGTCPGAFPSSDFRSYYR